MSKNLLGDYPVYTDRTLGEARFPAVIEEYTNKAAE